MIENAYFPVDLAFNAVSKRHENNCGQLQKNMCRNNQCLLLNLVHRQTSVNFKDKTFAVRDVWTICSLNQGVLRSIWSGRLECFFVDPKGAKISKNGNNIICTS